MILGVLRSSFPTFYQNPFPILQTQFQFEKGFPIAEHWNPILGNFHCSRFALLDGIEMYKFTKQIEYKQF